MRILFILLPFISFGQISNIDFNYAWVDAGTIDQSKITNGKQEMQAVFYPDAIPLKEWFNAKNDTISFSYILNDGQSTKTIDSLYIINRYEWAENLPLSDYRALSIYNSTNALKKLYTYRNRYKPSMDTFRYWIEKISCGLQAKDEKGNWKEIDRMQRNADRNKTYLEDSTFILENRNPKMFIQSHESVNLIVKPPVGNFETELRYKIWVNGPPEYPQEQYIYSNTFKGTINKLLLSIK